MLVLTRRQQQSIMIGNDIVVTVLEVKGDQIRLGITAPRDVQVNREEIVTALADANRDAVLATGTTASDMPPSSPTEARSRRRPDHTTPRRTVSRGRAA